MTDKCCCCFDFKNVTPPQSILTVFSSSGEVLWQRFEKQVDRSTCVTDANGNIILLWSSTAASSGLDTHCEIWTPDGVLLFDDVQSSSGNLYQWSRLIGDYGVVQFQTATPSQPYGRVVDVEGSVTFGSELQFDVTKGNHTDPWTVANGHYGWVNTYDSFANPAFVEWQTISASGKSSHWLGRTSTTSDRSYGYGFPIGADCVIIVRNGGNDYLVRMDAASTVSADVELWKTQFDANSSGDAEVHDWGVCGGAGENLITKQFTGTFGSETASRFNCHRLSDGAELWTIDQSHTVNGFTTRELTVSPDESYFGYVVNETGSTSDDHTAVVRDASDGSLVFSKTVYFTSSVNEAFRWVQVANDRVYIPSNDTGSTADHLGCYDMSSGDLIWATQYLEYYHKVWPLSEGRVAVAHESLVVEDSESF